MVADSPSNLENGAGPEASSTLRIAAAQLENVVGDIDGNSRRIGEAMAWAAEQDADVLLLPELVLTGYPLEDLAVREDLVLAARDALEGLAAASTGVTTVVGTIDAVAPQRSWDTQARDVSIGAAVLCDGELRGVYHKVLLPNYAVFDEARNFAPGRHPRTVWRIGEAVVGISICEDSWSEDGPPEAQAAAGAQVLLIQNASPFERGKSANRLAHCRRLAGRNGVPVVYVNLVGGQDELVFDGGSLVVDAGGELIARAPQFRTGRFCIDLELAAPRATFERPRTVHARPARRRAAPLTEQPTGQLEGIEEIWQALVLGTRDFAHRNGTGEAVLGISGGIDSAVSAAVAADALGAANVLCLSMPVEGTPAAELEDARMLVEAIGLEHVTVPIDEILATTGSGLAPITEHRPAGRQRRDLLARMRGTVLLAVADELERIALATVNKTELSLGSSTLHGEMAGSFAPIKDCPKSLLYELARHRNVSEPLIPDRIIDRMPTALAGETMALSSFESIDPILDRRLEEGAGLEEIVAAGFDAEIVRGVLQLIDDSEQERRQSPPGVKITRRAFGTDRRVPITSAWRPFRREQEILAPGIATLPVSDRRGGR